MTRAPAEHEHQPPNDEKDRCNCNDRGDLRPCDRDRSAADRDLGDGGIVVVRRVGSNDEESTATVFPTLPTGWVGSRSMVTAISAVAPAASVPERTCEHGSRRVQLPTLGAADTGTTPPGSVSVITTSVAVPGPALVTTMV